MYRGDQRILGLVSAVDLRAGYIRSACGVPSATDQNMQSSLVDAYGLNLLSGIYWSSTEGATTPQLDAWFHTFAPGGGAAQGMVAKNTELGTRCVRALTP
jgi:hypothetical protein